MMDSTSAAVNTTRTWRVRHPYLTDHAGNPEYYRGNAPSFHALCFHLGISGVARMVLAITQPAATWIYIVVYAGCVAAALGIGAVARARERHDRNFGRKLSAFFGLLTFVLTSMVGTWSAQPAAAKIVPLVACGVTLVVTLIAAKLVHWSPDQPRADSQVSVPER